LAETLSARMAPAEARRVQDEARVRGEWLVWFVSVSGGKARAWAVVADRHGGKRQPGELEADTLAELRAILPAGLTRWRRTSVMSPEVLEVWDECRPVSSCSRPSTRASATGREMARKHGDHGHEQAELRRLADASRPP
jgi:hypothetical protein